MLEKRSNTGLSMDDSSFSDIPEAYEDENENTNTQSRAGSTDNDTPTVLAQKETRVVHRLRVLAYSVLLIVAITASVGVFWYSSQEEENMFQNEFQGHGSKVIISFQEDSFAKLQALASLSSELTRHALSKEMVWPFVTVTQSSYLLEPYLSLGDFAAIQIHPIVPAALRDVWETYSVANQGWIQEDLQVRGLNETDAEATPNLYSETSAISPYIKTYVGIDTSPGDWIPFWQYAPVIPNRFFINFNRLSLKGFHQEAKIVQTKKATLTPSWIFEPGIDLQSTQDFEFTDQLLRAGGFTGDYNSEPLSYIHYPIFNRFEADHHHEDDHHEDSESEAETAGILSATVYWTSYFADILPEGVEGIVCVIENPVQSFTYEINGHSAVFKGMQDLHDTQYDDMVLSADYASFGMETDAHDSHAHTHSRYTGVDLDEEYMSYKIRVYPSSKMESTYKSSQPLIYAFAMLFMFLFTASILILYDYMVGVRTQMVMRTAEKSNAVVASLFPKTVRDRIMEEATSSSMKKEEKKIGFSNKADSLPLGTDDRASIIADFFPEATIMFSDIKGFTAWCSTREPAQVFMLLESLYGSFDKVCTHGAPF